MSIYAKVSGSWIKVAPWGKSSGVWIKPKESYVKVLGAWKQYWLDGGVNDTTFMNGLETALSDNVESVSVQSDNKIICGGGFLNFSGTSTRRIIRLNLNGTLDTTFTTNTGNGFNISVFSIGLQSDGKIVCGGAFTTFNGTTVNRIARLNSNGTLDTDFTTNIGTGFINTPFATSIETLSIQSDDKIVCGGNFTSFNETSSIRLSRLNSDGTLDTTFATNTGTGFDQQVFSMAIQSDGKIVCGGFFTSFNGTNVTRITRLNSNGTLDTDFATNTGTGFNAQVVSIAIQSDGKIICVGGFTFFNGTTANRIARLNSDGTLDTSFAINIGTGFNSFTRSTAVQSDGKIVCGGFFTSFNGTNVTRITRLNSNGTLDTDFATNVGTGFNNTVNAAIRIQADDKILVGGSFTQFNGINRSYLTRIGGE